MMVVSVGGRLLDDRLLPVTFIIVLALVFALIYIAAKYFKCPHCGSGFTPRYLPDDATHCPYCGGKLE